MGGEVRHGGFDRAGARKGGGGEEGKKGVMESTGIRSRSESGNAKTKGVFKERRSKAQMRARADGKKAISAYLEKDQAAGWSDGKHMLEGEMSVRQRRR